jgi:hypothetical protein
MADAGFFFHTGSLDMMSKSIRNINVTYRNKKSAGITRRFV